MSNIIVDALDAWDGLVMSSYEAQLIEARKGDIQTFEDWREAYYKHKKLVQENIPPEDLIKLGAEGRYKMLEAVFRRNPKK